MNRTYRAGYSDGYSLQKEAIAPALAAALPILKGTGTFLSAISLPAFIGYGLYEGKKGQKQFEEAMRQQELSRAATDRSTKALQRAKDTGYAAVGGGALGGLASNLWGKLKGRPDISRDLLSALLGAGAGAAIQEMSVKGKKEYPSEYPALIDYVY